jgi:hypothetical protein
VAPAVRAVALGEAPPLPQGEPVAYLVARVSGVVTTEAIDVRGAEVLAHMVDGATFAEACIAAGGENSAAPAVIALARACRAGVVLALQRERRSEREIASANASVFFADAERVQ